MKPDFQIGQRLIGRIIKLMPFGAFVELDASERVGLVKIPEIAWQPVSHPADILTLGQAVEVEILALELDDRISLSIKRCQPRPGDR
jgi:small subunit ribosomal protein S1